MNDTDRRTFLKKAAMAALGLGLVNPAKSYS
ncbi:MAG: twin-arginine translocation signal domain-containing protein, partial [Bacteroidales bacterium]|nr:twin-arginine translocation signal domain-containing protein [Bacteroidales bacterium]